MMLPGDWKPPDEWLDEWTLASVAVMCVLVLMWVLE
jgi:hypothetical protein